jgi:hypothetical protein
MSTYDVYGDSFTTSDFTNGSKSVSFKLESNSIIKYIRTRIILYNDPIFTNITAKISYDNNGSIGSLYKNSITTWAKSQILTLDNGCNELYFEFEDIVLDKNNKYHFQILGTGANFSDSSHIAWKTSYPFPVYVEGWTPAFRKLPQFPYDFVATGEKF